MEPITLILDADDTLWENNIFYEEATDAFVRRMAGEGFDEDQARRLFEQVERERIPLVGYAPLEFVNSMLIAYRRLCQMHGRLPDASVAAEVEAIARRVIDYPIILLEGVAETLPRLHRHCRLFLLTKGHPPSQQSKIDRSGLAPYFEAVHIVAEKDADVLRDLLARYGLDAGRTWMVGNSPRSDINPALAAGLRAVYIPYAHPWSWEHAPLLDPVRVVTLSRFSELLDLFAEAS